jgi:hypothetical protein
MWRRALGFGLMKAISGWCVSRVPCPWGVASDRAFLAAFARDDPAVEVHRHRTDVDLRGEPALPRGEHRSVERSQKRLSVLWLGSAS